jgi:hypothetical protein
MERTIGYADAMMLSTLTVTEFKKFRRAMFTITKAGVCREQAIVILIDARMNVLRQPMRAAK